VRLFTLAAVVLAATAGASAAAAGGGFPSGSFAASLSGQSPAFLNGGWKLTFKPGGAYTTAHPASEVVARGRLAVSGGTVTFGKETGALGCSTTGRYRWTYSGGSLRFARVSDACGGRAIVLTTKPFRPAD
jgi:hypothetical protein